jgi:hypothetical protein
LSVRDSQRARIAQSSRKRERVDARLKLCGTIRLPRGSEEGLSGINYPWPLTSDEPYYTPGRETGRSSGKVKNPNADPRQKHSPHSPHSPRQNPGDGEPGNVGKGGKDIPVNNMVSLRSPDGQVADGMPRSGRPVSADARGWRPADTITAAGRRIIEPAGKGSQCVTGVR